MGIIMDRRQRKTKESIFNAFISLLSKKSYNKITIKDIIDTADIGRATFYSHFETKDFLLKALCEELFDHIFNGDNENSKKESSIFKCDIHDDVFLHLFKHIKKNDNNICKLLTSKNNDLFLEYFKSEMRLLVVKSLAYFKEKRPINIPEDFWVNHITLTFIETLRWWLDKKMQILPEVIYEYFLSIV